MIVTLVMEDDTFDLIMTRALEDHIKYCYTDVYRHEEDVHATTIKITTTKK